MSARILIVRLSHLGDVVHALPVYHALRQAHPAAELAWAVQPEFADLIEGLPGLARTFHFARRAGLAAWTRLRNEFAEWRPDWVVDAQGNTKSAMVALASGAARRSGLAQVDWRERFGAHVTTDRAEPATGPHAIDRMFALARHVAPRFDAARARLDADLTPAERADGRAALSELDPAPDWIVHLSSPGDVRAWPTEHFEVAVRTLVDAGRSVLVLSGPAEIEVGQRLRERVQAAGVTHWVGQRGLRGLAAIMTAAAGTGCRMLACDSGPAHLAAAAGLAVDLLAGPQDARRTGPWPTRPLRGRPAHRVLSHPDPPSCAPCSRRRCDHPAGAVCLSGLTPRHVAENLLGVNRPGASADSRILGAERI